MRNCKMIHSRRDDCTIYERSQQGLAIGSAVHCGGKTYTIRRKVKTPRGNFICIAYTTKESEERDNRASCEVLTDLLGWTCVLLPRDNLCKTADMFNANDGTLWEIKTTKKGSANAIDKAMKRAVLQAQNMILRFDMEGVDLDEKGKIVLYKNHKYHLKNIMLIAESSILLLHDEH